MRFEKLRHRRSQALHGSDMLEPAFHPRWSGSRYCSLHHFAVLLLCWAIKWNLQEVKERVQVRTKLQSVCTAPLRPHMLTQRLFSGRLLPDTWRRDITAQISTIPDFPGVAQRPCQRVLLPHPRSGLSGSVAGKQKTTATN